MKLTKKHRRMIGKLIRAKQLPARKYRILIFNQEDGVIFLGSRDVTFVAYIGKR